MKTKTLVQRKISDDERGMATIEALPLLFIFVFLTAYTLGFFGVIHTAILSSISARAYAFETFRNRTNLMYFRDGAGANANSYNTMHLRTHMVLSESRQQGDDQIRAIERPIRIGVPIQAGPSRNDLTIHNEKIFTEASLGDQKRNTKIEASPVWIMIQYGICVDSNCGPD